MRFFVQKSVNLSTKPGFIPQKCGLITLFCSLHAARLRAVMLKMRNNTEMHRIWFVIFVMVLFTPQLPAQAAQNTDWFRDTKYGIIGHWLPYTRDIQDFNTLVDGFDVEGLADQLEQTGVGFFILTLSQSSPYFPAPNPTYDALAGAPYCSKRDLISDLHKALEPKGIKLFVYLPSEATGDATVQAAMKYTSECPAGQSCRRVEFQLNYQKVIADWSKRWGNKVAGWWFDGCYDWKAMYSHADAPNFASFAAAARAGNPQAIVAFNDGNGPYSNHSEHGDYTAGEVHNPDMKEGAPYIGQALLEPESRFVEGIDPVSNQPYKLQWHLQSFLGHQFVGNGYGGVKDTPRFTDEYLIEFVKRTVERGGVVSFDVPMNLRDAPIGHISENFMPQLRALKAAMRSNTPPSPRQDVALGRPATASSNFPGASPSHGNDGTLASNWASANGDPEPWWQVDLLRRHHITGLQIVARQDGDQPFTRYNFEFRGSDDPTFATYSVLAAQFSFTTWPSQGTWSVGVSGHMRCRYVRVVKTDKSHFNFAEVHVVGYPETKANEDTTKG